MSDQKMREVEIIIKSNDEEMIKDVNLTIMNELTEQYERIYAQNLDEMVKFQKTEFYFKIIGYISLISFFIMLAIKVQNLEKGFSYLYLLIPIYIFAISFTICGILYLRLKEFFDRAQKILRDEIPENCSLGNFLTFICMIMSSLCVLTYATLICLKLQNYLINSYFNIISIPIYILIGVCFFYFIFILPAFIYNKFYSLIGFISIYLISFTIFSILLNLKLDQNLENFSYIKIFLSLIIAMSLNLIFNIFTLFNDGCINIMNNLKNIITISLLITGTIIIPIKVDKINENLPNYIPVILYLLSLVILIDFKSIFGKSEEDEDEEEE